MSSTEVQSKKSSPGIIAKLMGLDGLPPQQKRLSEVAQTKNPSRKRDEMKNTLSNGLSRRSTKEQQEFKDVFEVSEASLTKSFSFERIQKSNLTDEKMMLIRQKFADAKRLSTNKKLQDSDIFDDRLKVLYCKRDKLHSLQKLDFLSARHMYSNEANMKARSKRYNSHDFRCTPERRNPQPLKYNSSPQIHGDWGSTYFNSNHVGRGSFQMKGEEDLSNMATKIVILKPNLGKEQNAANIVSPSCSSHFFGSGFRTREFPSTTNRMTNTLGKKSSPPDSRSTRHDHRGSQEIAKEVNTLMRSYSNFPSSRIYYYYESGSSSDESANETEMGFLQSRNSLQSNNQQRHSSSSCKESFVSREAKKRISERWKLTNISHDKDVVRQSSTLAEMLAIPVKEFVPANLDFSRIREKQFQNRLLNEDGLAGWNEPPGISSRDGTKVVSYEGSYRSTSSSPVSMAGFGKSKTRMVRKTHFSDKYATPEEAMKLERNKAIDLHLNRDKIDPFSLCKAKEIKGISSELHYIPNQANSVSLRNRSFETHYAGLESPTGIDKGESIENNFVSEPYESLPEILANGSEKCDSRSIGPNTSVVEEETDVGQSMDISVSSQDHQQRLQSPAKQEPDQQSPVSILEPPFKDDFSSCSDCFNSLSADLHGLRMQLQLLKLESESYAGGPFLISSDKEGSGEESLRYSDDQDRLGEDESWEFSYICEVLSDSGLDYSDPNESKKTWLSPEFPVNPLIFEELEKKREGCTTQPRSERKLLFDRINGGIVEIFQPFVKPLKGKTLTAQLGPKWTKEGLERNLYKLLMSSQETKGKEDSAEKVVERESQWLNLGDDIEVIGEEIGRFLIDELVATELVCFCS